MDNFTTYTQTTTIFDIYGSDYNVPLGYLPIAFRPPLKGELYLNILKKVEIASESEKSNPRLILKKIPTKANIYPIGYQIPEGYREIDFRTPNKGDYYLYAGEGAANSVLEALRESYEYTSPQVIVEKVPQSKSKKWVVEVLENEARTLKPGEVGVQSLNNLSLMFWPEYMSFNTSDKYYPAKITGE